MSDFATWIETLRRPQLLLRAAKIGQSDYNREQVLKRLAPGGAATPERALATLIPVEEQLELARQAGDASYVPSRHVEVLIALMAELRSLMRAQRLV